MARAARYPAADQPAAGRRGLLPRGLASAVTGLGAVAGEGGEEALRRQLLVATSVGCMVAGLVWSATYFAAGAPVAASAPLAYAVLSFLSTLAFAVTRRQRVYLVGQLVQILLLPWIMTVALGGFHASSAVIIWSLLAPLGGLLFSGTRLSVLLFAAFVVLVVSTALVPPSPFDPPLDARLISAFYAMNLVVLSAIVFAMLLWFVHRKNLFQERSEMLLLSILPGSIAELLKTSPGRVADHYDAVSILFADIVGFTGLSRGVPPAEIVAMLEEIFDQFDRLVDESGLEKIKTIGDCYMVASGVPTSRDDHAQALACLALEMQRAVHARKFHGRRIRLRIGINSGPVVAGIIGRKRFLYDLWGDAVNLASRMESYAENGSIQLSRATYELVRGEFDCRASGILAVDGFGEMDVFRLVGARPGAAAPTAP